jgi:hypothetical protein
MNDKGKSDGIRSTNEKGLLTQLIVHFSTDNDHPSVWCGYQEQSQICNQAIDRQ